MKPLYRGLAVAALQCAIVLSVAGKYAWDRERLPRVWIKTAPYDPNLPIRGRYVSLRVEADGPSTGGNTWIPVRLSVENQRLVAIPDSTDVTVNASCSPGRCVLTEPVAFFISEHVADPSRREPGEELWVEVSVPPNGPPRPLQLGVKKDGVLLPLDLR